ncbi:MAG: di-heme oxidoredictase family protein [bacterium]|nr:hypothetical protein [Planctomycetota bacterium]HIL52126.1 hypothetical protein [Planctomycetota bacterium]
MPNTQVSLYLSWSLLFSVASAANAAAQYSERSETPGVAAAVDVSGRSVKNKRVRAIHSNNPSDMGSTAYFIKRDPFLAYQLGRNLNFREFRTRDGVFSAIADLGGPMPDGTTAKITAHNQVSCSGCHNLPQGNPGGGTNFSKDSGFGRQAPHYYGAGIVEMLAIQVRAEILSQIDTNSDGWVSAPEAQAAAIPVRVQAATGPFGMLEYGNPRLSGGATGSPSLNNIFRVWYVDAAGRVVPGATSVDGLTTFGYNFGMIVWGWGQGSGRSALNPTNRAFLWDPWNAHGGLQAFDPSTLNDPDGDGVSLPTLSGAIQFPATHQAPDAGNQRDPLGFSLDDPDGDGYLSEISEGDLDLGEFFMLNAPRPAFAGTNAEYRQGVLAMAAMGCTDCHTPNWTIRSQDAVFAGDRRLFDIEVNFDSVAQRLEGELVPLYTYLAGTYTPNRGSFQIRGFFSDLKHHDMGAGFAEVDFGGTVNTLWRTPMLWGVASGFPWGHDGQSLTLRDAIMRHDGEGAASRQAWLAATPMERQAVLGMLRKMQLYDIETLACDITGDGAIEASYIVAGMATGIERFNAEWLFSTPARIQGPITNIDGLTILSSCVVNVDVAYGQDLTWRKDSDDDGWPDVWDNAPLQAGFKDGVNN